MRRRFNRRGSAAGAPTRTWASLADVWTMAAVGATTANVMIQLQAPTTLSNLTSDPPEDLTVLRIRGSFSVSISNVASQWNLALLVQDTTWTPANTFDDDADKRILWSRCFVNPTAVAAAWRPPGSQTVSGVDFAGQGLCDVDIAPKVRIEPGKALYLVVYEEGATAATFSTSSTDMRVLFQRSGRRSR